VALTVVFAATGNARDLEKSFVANGGRYVLVSVVKDAIAFTDPLLAAHRSLSVLRRRQPFTAPIVRPSTRKRWA
jgi:hypothetical protein